MVKTIETMKRQWNILKKSTWALEKFTYINEDDEDMSEGPKSDSKIVEAVRNEMQSHGDDENWVDEEDDDARDTNLPPINANFQHPSAMISMSTGDLVPSRAPCPYNLKSNESKHWQSLCNTCDISYACTTQHAIL